MTTVLFVQGSAERAGAERVLLALLRNIDQERFCPVVAFLARGPFENEVAAAGVETLELPEVGRLRDPRSVQAAVASLSTCIRATRPAIVQATGEKMSVLTGWAGRGSGVPTVFWLHDSPAPPRRVGAFTTQAVMAATPRASVVACARWVAAAFNGRFRARATSIENGIELDLLPEPGAGARAAVLHEMGWSDDAVVVGHFGRLEPWKGAEDFLRAGSRLLRRVPTARLLVVGGALYGRAPRFGASLRTLARELGIADRTVFTGHRADALQLMAGCDIVVHASREPDPFPTVVIEAMALGRGLIATRSRGPEEQVAHQANGLLARAGDERSLFSAMERLGLDTDARQRLGASAARDARRRFDASRMARDFGGHWTEMLR